MQIILKQDIKKYILRFIGEVSYRDEEKFETYKNIFKDAKTENDLKDNLKKEGLPQNAINEFCNTLTKLRVIDDQGNISEHPLIGEYGDYKIEFLSSGKDTPYNWLPIKLERTIQNEKTNESSTQEIDKKWCNAFAKAQQLVADKAVGIVHKIDSPRSNFHAGSTEISIDINPEKDNWILRTNDNSFTIPVQRRLSINKFFKDNLLEEDGDYYLEMPLDKVKEKGGKDAIQKFICTFNEGIDSDWGIFNAEYKNINILPRKEEFQKWYTEIFNNTLKISGYRSQADLKFAWDEILRDNPSLQREEYKDQVKSFDYENLIERYQPNNENYWLLQAATDLDPYKLEQNKNIKQNAGNSINIPVSQSAQIQDVLSKWEKLDTARTIIIVDQYANNFHSIKTLNALMKEKSLVPEKIIIYSIADEKIRDDYQQEFINNFEKKYNVKFIIRERPQMPHDRYWILDGDAFTVGISPNSIWIRKDHIIIKEQLNINSISDENLPRDIRDWRNENV